jgi:hypothetical protein
VAGTWVRMLFSGDPHLRNDLMVFNGGGSGRANLLFYDSTGALQFNWDLPLPANRSLIFVDVNGLAKLSGGGRIEVVSREGSRLNSWLTSTDRVTGDSDELPAQILLP